MVFLVTLMFPIALLATCTFGIAARLYVGASSPDDIALESLAISAF
ncbi:MAG: hypothetical protein ACJARS_003966 [bacterium]|jgi:hypothetical protein